MGTYTPAWKARFGTPLVDQMIAIFQRDQAAALAIVNAARAAKGNAALGPINDFHKGPIMDVQPPCLFASYVGVGFRREDAYTRRQAGRIELALTVPDVDPEMATVDAADYAWMMDMIVTTPPTSDWEAALTIDNETMPEGVTVPNATGTIKDVFVESHTLLETKREERELPSLAVHLVVLFELEEA